MSKEIPKVYEPAEHEDAIYEKWDKSGFFNPDNLEGEPYSIMMPPPNVTGVLHLGHALENSLMDVMIRYQRMRGKKALLLPGTDHAAVATQAKVEKVLAEKGMKNPREELGREGLLEEIKNYSENSKATILKQIRKMGTSCDWSRLSYTFSDKLSRSVNEVFIRMYNDGLIYRGYKVINWTVKGQSTCSDDELEHVERKAKIYTFKYAKDFPISIATTRPETKLGDTAVAVNPGDERYKKYIGEVFTVEIGAAKPLQIKIISDENVDQNFGTGAIGVTPAHSAIDFEMYEKQKAKGEPIEIIQVIGKDGKMTAEAGKDYVGLGVIEARDKFVAWLQTNNLLEKEEEINQSVGTSDRYKDIVEALPMTQWFVDVNKKIPGRNKSLKDLMREAVTTGHGGDKNKQININPEQFERIYYNWIDNLRDWCISRQIWWGHRIPVWYKDEEISVGAEEPAGSGWIQDDDTLDTWFSSGLWTFSTLGWPDKTEDLKTFHSSSWMQMGHELLFFWMARMILMSTYVLDEIPFKNVYIHGILRDEKGNKFSKSSGNNLDPIEVIEKYGTDALRLSLLIGVAPGQDSKYFEEKVVSARNMVNKIWNISRFIIMSGEEHEEAELAIASSASRDELTLADKWILTKLNILIRDVTNDFEDYKFSQAGEKLREFTWNDLADWYLEVNKFEKTVEKNAIMQMILRNILKLWHPFMPFVTEAIWAEFNKEMLIVSPWPESESYSIDKGEGEMFNVIQEIIIAIRNARAENQVEPCKKVKAVIVTKNKELIESQAVLIQSLKTGIDTIEITDKDSAQKDAISIVVGDIKIYLLGAIDKDKEKVRIIKEVENLEKYIKITDGKLSNKNFVDRAPKEVVEREQETLKIKKEELSALKSQLENL